MRMMIVAGGSIALVVAAPAAADSIDFRQFGPRDRMFANSVAGVTRGGVAFTITGPGGGFTSLEQGQTASGAFPDGNILLTPANRSPGMTSISFATTIDSIDDLGIQPGAASVNYVATLSAFGADGVTLLGTDSYSANSDGAPGTQPGFSLAVAGIGRISFGTTFDQDGTLFGNVVPAPIGSTVPEPATWMSMLAGFGLAGAALRRRPRALKSPSR